MIRAIPSLAANNANFFTSTEFYTSDANDLRFGIRDLFIVTVLSSTFALLSWRFRSPLASRILLDPLRTGPAGTDRSAVMVDLLAAVPSIIFGLWGIFVLAPWPRPVATVPQRRTLGWFFAVRQPGTCPLAGGGTIFTAGVVLAVMILPIITAVTREVYRQTPGAHMEAAQALGATKWEIDADDSPARSGAAAPSLPPCWVSAARWARQWQCSSSCVGRSSAGHWSLFDGGYTFASKIASAAAEFSAPLPTGAYIAAGFVLFVLTFVVNAVAREIAGGKVHG